MAFVGINPDPYSRVPKGTLLSMLGVSVKPAAYTNANGEYDSQKQADDYNRLRIKIEKNT